MILIIKYKKKPKIQNLNIQNTKQKQIKEKAKNLKIIILTFIFPCSLLL